jgi:hypothetical protein
MIYVSYKYREIRKQSPSRDTALSLPEPQIVLSLIWRRLCLFEKRLAE